MTMRVRVFTIIFIGLSLLIMGGLLYFGERGNGDTRLVQDLPYHTPQHSLSDYPLSHFRWQDTEVTLAIARTPEDQNRGLSGIPALGENEGLLFVFEKPDMYGFWMKDMHFPIDIIWISDNLEVRRIIANVAPETFPQTFPPPEPVRYVLEMNAGWTERHGIVIGAVVPLTDILDERASTEGEMRSPAELLPDSEPQEGRDAITSSQEASLILLNVPFTPQAPFGEWGDPVYQDGCEEAAALMAIRWVRGADLTRKEAKKEILAISNYELETYGGFHDTSAQDTAERIFRGYFGYQNVEVVSGVNADDIRAELERGNLVVTPMDGRLLENPFYTPPGPERHMLIIRGYDPETKEFITNDAGTRRGEEYRYPEAVLENAIRDYPTGDHEPITDTQKTMIVVRPQQ